jgi:large subunit ribosomal protein L4
MALRRLAQRAALWSSSSLPGSAGGASCSAPAAAAAAQPPAAWLPHQLLFARGARALALRAPRPAAVVPGDAVGPSAVPRLATRGTVVHYPFAVRHMEAQEAPIYDLDRRVVGRIELPGDVFSVPVRVDILHRVVRWQRARRQQGTHKAKNRAEVRGGGRKPWKQKKTGRARQGSIRAPHFVHGGAAHGPKPRSHAHKLPKKVRRLGLKCALSAKAFEGRLLVLESLAPGEPRTRVRCRSCRCCAAAARFAPARLRSPPPHAVPLAPPVLHRSFPH